MRTLGFLTLMLLPAAWAQGDRDWHVQDQETIRRTFNLSGSGPQKLSVDNFSGYIHVTGTDGNQVRMTVLRRNRAESNDELSTAKRDVKLDATQDGDSVRLYVDAPNRRNNGDRHFGYQVIFDFDLEVPRGPERTRKGFNHGTIEVKGTTGDFNVHGFNGGVNLEDVAGAGNVETFNGPVKVTFAKNPARPSLFKTFNGSIDVYFQSALNADLRLKTFHGGIFSDSDLGPLTIPASTGENRNGRFVYRSREGVRAIRAGSGGPELSFDTFNGEIRLHSKTL
jgi:hypothetical protein